MTNSEVYVEGGETAKPAGKFTSTTGALAVSFLQPCEKNVAVLRKLNQHIFPVQYRDRFYDDCLASGPYTCMALYSDFVIGAICCRLEKAAAAANSARLYIMTLGVFAPYRRRKVGARLLNHIMTAAAADSTVDDVYLHVQVNNEEAMAFYRGFGFELKETIENYYQRIEPAGCHVFARRASDWSTPPGL